MFLSTVKRFLYLLLPLLMSLAAGAQTLTLQQAQQYARDRYPLLKQKELLEQTRILSADNLGKSFLPQVTLNGQATYQSEVTQVKIPLPGFTTTPLSKDQYKLTADINQLLYDGGLVKEQKQLQQLNEQNELQKLEVELYKLRERVSQVYLGVLFLDEQLKQVDLVKNDLQNGIRKVEAQVQNGVAFRSNLNVLKAEWLKAGQRIIELNASRRGLLDVLAVLMQEPVHATIVLQKPSGKITTDTVLQRPELQWFATQQQLISGQDKLITAKNLPKASLFAQGGYGRPGLNFLKNEFEFYYITGIRFSWALGNLYTKKNERQQLDVSKRMVKVQEDVFLLNTKAQLKQQEAEQGKLQQLITTDREIISLRQSVKEAAKAQLENGVITANDYLREVNAEDQARQTLITHELQLLQAQINYQTILGK